MFKTALRSLGKRKDIENNAPFDFTPWTNTYLSDKELSKEFRYVFDRRLAARYQGNTLERPKLLLKRLHIQQTQIEDESGGMEI
jgi:hypothetical protein